MPDQKLACPKCQAAFTLPVEMLIAPEGRVAVVKCPGCARKSPVVALVNEVARVKREEQKAFRARVRAAQAKIADEQKSLEIERIRQKKAEDQQQRKATRAAMKEELQQKETAKAIASAIDSAHIVPSQPMAHPGSKTKVILAVLSLVTVVGLGCLYLQFSKKESEVKPTAKKNHQFLFNSKPATFAPAPPTANQRAVLGFALATSTCIAKGVSEKDAQTAYVTILNGKLNGNSQRDAEVLASGLCTLAKDTDQCAVCLGAVIGIVYADTPHSE